MELVFNVGKTCKVLFRDILLHNGFNIKVIPPSTTKIHPQCSLHSAMYLFVWRNGMYDKMTACTFLHSNSQFLSEFFVHARVIVVFNI